MRRVSIFVIFCTAFFGFNSICFAQQRCFAAQSVGRTPIEIVSVNADASGKGSIAYRRSPGSTDYLYFSSIPTDLSSGGVVVRVFWTACR